MKSIALFVLSMMFVAQIQAQGVNNANEDPRSFIDFGVGSTYSSQRNWMQRGGNFELNFFNINPTSNFGLAVTAGLFSAKTDEFTSTAMLKSKIDTANFSTESNPMVCYFAAIGLCYAINLPKHVQLTTYVEWGGAQYILPKQTLQFDNKRMLTSDLQKNIDFCQNLGMNIQYMPPTKHICGGVNFKYFLGSTNFTPVYQNGSDKTLSFPDAVFYYNHFSVMLNLAYVW
jgi:hypothetical protein